MPDSSSATLVVAIIAFLQFVRTTKGAEAAECFHALIIKSRQCPSLWPMRLADGLGPRSVPREKASTGSGFGDTPQSRASALAGRWFPHVVRLLPFSPANNFGR